MDDRNGCRLFGSLRPSSYLARAEPHLPASGMSTNTHLLRKAFSGQVFWDTGLGGCQRRFFNEALNQQFSRIFFQESLGSAFFASLDRLSNNPIPFNFLPVNAPMTLHLVEKISEPFLVHSTWNSPLQFFTHCNPGLE